MRFKYEKRPKNKSAHCRVCERERANEKLGLRIWASAPTPHSFQKGHGQGEKCGPRICKSSKCPCKLSSRKAPVTAFDEDMGVRESSGSETRQLFG